MFKMMMGVAVVLAAVASPPRTEGIKAPEFPALKWYNTAPMTLKDLEGKAVLIDVFRTW